MFASLSEAAGTNGPVGVASVERRATEASRRPGPSTLQKSRNSTTPASAIRIHSLRLQIKHFSCRIVEAKL